MTETTLKLNQNAQKLMKLFRTSSAAIVEDCQKFFHLLPVRYLIDLRTTKFLETFVTNENCVCKLFARNAQCGLDKIFQSYGNSIISSCTLRSFVNDMFFE